MVNELTLRIVLENPPAGVDYGIQKGRGSGYETIQRQRSTGDDLRFEFRIAVSGERQGFLTFSGPFAQGPAGDRFVYIDIGTYAGQKDTPWSRRLKIPLTEISAKMLKTSGGVEPVLETHVPGTGKDGGPSCASIKFFEGWKPAA